MARGRSKSLVQSIASDGPHISSHTHNDHTIEGSASSKKTGDSSRSIASSISASSTKPTLTRSRSIPTFHKPKQIDKLDPFTSHEFDSLWNEHIDGFYPGNTIDYETEKYVNLHQLRQVDIHNFHQILSVNLHQLHSFQTDVGDLDSKLFSIRGKYNEINTQTVEFNTQSQMLLKTEAELNSKVESINMVLKNFENLEDIIRKLSTPNNLKLIRSQSFKKILENLNSSLEFFNTSDKKLVFKNIEIYKIKFRQCMTRALTLIKDYLISDLKKLEAQITVNKDPEIMKIAIDKEFEDYLTEYEQDFYSFHNLIEIFLIRIEDKHELEYKGLLMEVLTRYLRTRETLLTRVQVFGHGDIEKDNLVKFTQDNLLSIKNLLNREFKLFKRFFRGTTNEAGNGTTGNNGNHGVTGTIPQFMISSLYDFFKVLTEPFYDLIRHKILKETNISSLCQLTNLLQNNYYEFESYHEDQIDFSRVFQPILDDCQTRLIFRIQIYIDNRLVPYKPTAEDLKLGHTQDPKKNPLDEDFPDNLFEELYLPLGKALTILSNIYELINSVVFDDLAHYIVHSCIDILKTGSALCQKLSGDIDSKLYYLKNLIILKYQLSNFDIQFVRTETSLDFTSGLNELYNLIRHGEILININQGGWFNLIKKTVPKIINNMIDAKLEVELEINNCINELLTNYLNSLIDPLNKIAIDKVTQEELDSSFAVFKQHIYNLTPQFKSQIIGYINDYNILKILFNNLINVLVNYYEDFHLNLINLNRSLNLDDVLEPEVFNNFFTGVVDELLDDDSLQNNLLDIKPLLRFEEELDDTVVYTETGQAVQKHKTGHTNLTDSISPTNSADSNHIPADSLSPNIDPQTNTPPTTSTPEPHP